MQGWQHGMGMLRDSKTPLSTRPPATLVVGDPQMRSGFQMASKSPKRDQRGTKSGQTNGSARGRVRKRAAPMSISNLESRPRLNGARQLPLAGAITDVVGPCGDQKMKESLIDAKSKGGSGYVPSFRLAYANCCASYSNSSLGFGTLSLSGHGAIQHGGCTVGGIR